MSEPNQPLMKLTEEEHQEIDRRAWKLHQLANLGGAFPLGDYVVDYVQGVGVWIYSHKQGHQELIYSNNISNSHVNIEDTHLIREVLDQLRRAMVLEDLADV